MLTVEHTALLFPLVTSLSIARGEPLYYAIGSVLPPDSRCPGPALRANEAAGNVGTGKGAGPGQGLLSGEVKRSPMPAESRITQIGSKAQDLFGPVLGLHRQK